MHLIFWNNDYILRWQQAITKTQCITKYREIRGARKTKSKEPVRGEATSAAYPRLVLPITKFKSVETSKNKRFARQPA